MLDDLRMAVRFARDFRAFLGRPYTAEDCHRLLKDQLARRDESFLRIMARAVFGNVRSPYFVLMRQAKVQYGDVAAWIRRQGVEGALADPAIRGSRRFNGDHSARRVGCGLAAVLAVHRLWQIAPPTMTLGRSVVVSSLAYTLGVLWPVAGFLVLLKLLVISSVVLVAFLMLGELTKSELAVVASILPWRTAPA